MIVALRVKHGTDRFGKPIATLRNLPGLDAEATAADLVELAHVLIQVAETMRRPIHGERTYHLRHRDTQRPEAA